MLRFLTAGESHGPELVAVVEGYPAGFDIDLAKINNDLARRQKGYGRGGRMAIERDEVRVVSGIRFGRSMGSSIGNGSRWPAPLSSCGCRRSASASVRCSQAGECASKSKYR